MAFEYVWLKVLEALARAGRQLSRRELGTELERRHFPLSEEEITAALEGLRRQELVRILVLTEPGGETFERIAITPSGERKVRGIVRL